MTRRKLRSIAVCLLCMGAVLWAIACQSQAPVSVTVEPTSSLQARLNAAATSNRMVDLRPLESISAKLAMPNQSGTVLQGGGSGESMPAGSSLLGGRSEIRWTGSYGGSDPMLEYTGTDLTIRDCSITGGSRAQLDGGTPENYADDLKAPIAIHMKRGAGGIGTGKLHVQQVLFEGFQTALKIGTAAGDANCDESDYTNCIFQRCDTCVHMLNDQALGHVFRNLRTGIDVDVVFLIEAGGDLDVQRAFLGTGAMKFLSVVGVVGVNNGTSKFDGIKIDAQAVNTVLLDIDLDNVADSDPGTPGTQTEYARGLPGARFFFEHVWFPSADWTVSAFENHRYASVTISDSTMLQAGMLAYTDVDTGSATANPAYVIENVTVNTAYGAVDDVRDLFNPTLGQCTGKCYVSTRNVRDWLTGELVVADGNTVIDDSEF